MTDNTPNIGLTNPIVGGSLYETLTHFDETLEGIYLLERNYGTEFAYFMNALSFGASEATNHPDYEVITKRRPRKVRVGQITVRTDNGNGTLTLTLSDNTIEFFREKETVIDNGGNYKTALVISKSPGSITIEVTGGADAFVSADFAVGEYITSGWTLAGNEDSTGVTQLSRYGDIQYDYCSVARESFSYKANQKVVKKLLGTSWYHFAEAEQEAYKRYYEGKAKKQIFSERGMGTNSPEGTTSNTRGLLQGMREDGLALSLNSAPTLQDLEDMVMFSSQARGDWETDLTLNLSNNMKMYINRQFGQDFIKPVGTANTFGGNSVVGDNIQLYNFGNIPMKFQQWLFLNDNQQFPSPTNISGLNGTKANFRFFLGSWSPIPSMNANGNITGTNMMPVVRKIHFANDAGESFEKPLHNVIQGVTPNQRQVSSPVPAEQHEIMSIDGLAGIFDTFAIAELAS